MALQPSTGGTFVITLEHAAQQHSTIWDRKTDGGFPETKELKRRVRDVIEPGRDLGHVDGHKAVSKEATKDGATGSVAKSAAEGQKCEDCA